MTPEPEILHFSWEEFKAMSKLNRALCLVIRDKGLCTVEGAENIRI